jgi:hypothetical protein
MATPYLRGVASRGKLDRGSSTEEQSDAGLGAKMRDRLRYAICAIQGHDSLRQFERQRVFLKCTSCGHESPGWDLDLPQPRPETRRAGHRALSPVVGTRRVA